MGELRVISPGPFTTVQDLGRPGSGHLGVPIGGAADTRSHRIANRLVNNPDSVATLEMTLAGAELEFSHDVVVAVAGGHADLLLLKSGAQPRPVPTHHAVVLAAADRLKIGPITSGARAYLAISGGFDVAVTLGSRSTHHRAAFGGFRGRPLRANDILRWSDRHAPSTARIPFRAPAHSSPVSTETSVELRAVESIHAALFPATSAMFWNQPYTVSTSSDRAGVRLVGDDVASPGAWLPSEGLMPGAVQVPPDGQPIILGADHPTTGGYPVIACVIGSDLPLVAQLRPRADVRFRRVTLEEARRLWRESERSLDALIPPLNTRT